MQIVVLCDDVLKRELAADKAAGEISWVESLEQLLQYRTAGVFIDLLFQPDADRIEALRQLLPNVIIVNSVLHTLNETDTSFVRINGWPTFLQSALLEGSCLHEDVKAKAEQAMALFGKQIEWLPDEPGFITARVISMIINEAFFALGEDVSSAEEINTAMKLGTAYPYGPFEWGREIGMQNIVTLLNKLSKEQQRYRPCEWLVQETDRAI